MTLIHIVHAMARRLRMLRPRRPVRIRGLSFKVPFIQGFRCEHTEIWMTDLLSRLMRETNGAFVDVGVNLGQTLVKVKAIDRLRAYVGFEPNPLCVSYARQLIDMNQLRHCTIVPVGLFTADEVLRLDLFGADMDSAASVIQDFRPNDQVRGSMLVPVFRFESVSRHLDLSSVGIVKIDVEGAELEVIQSLQRLLRQQRPFILFEVLPVYVEEIAERKKRQDELERLLQLESFTIFRIKKTLRDNYAGLERIKSIGVHGDIRQCDYLAIPNEQAESMAQRLDAEGPLQ